MTNKSKNRTFISQLYSAIFLLLISSPFVAGGDKGPFDFVVVGSGAGSVVASRLSEQKHSVLLLEEGGDPNPEQNIPAKIVLFYNDKEYVNVYRSVPQSNAGLMNNGVYTYLGGRTLGGGTGVNAGVYNRGSVFDYDNWGNITGDPNWSYSNMLKYFKKIEDYDGEFPSEKHHGKGGPIPISRQKYAPGRDTWLEAGKALGYPVADPNGPQTVGFAPVEFNRRRGRRVSAYHGYIQSVLDTRPHLKVVKNAKVEKVVFEGNKAVGVKYTTKEGKEVTVRVSKEVILSAGSIETPVILMKSGIGPKDVLETAKISAVKHLPVGYNLHDHVSLQVHFNVRKDKADLFIPERDLNPETLKLYEETGDGPYSTFNGLHGQAFLVSSVRKEEKAPNPEWADILLHLIQTPSSFNVDGMAEVETKEHENADLSISTYISLSRPKSRGRVTLNPEDVNGDPLVDFQYLTHPDDVEIMVDAVKKVLQLHEETPSYQEQGARHFTTPLHFCKNFKFRSDEYWKCYINHMTLGSAHAAGTCKMGKKSDNDAVVDSHLKVIGVKSLRVIDASIMPEVTNANTMAPALVIGEKGADEILKYWKDGGGDLGSSKDRQEL